MGRDKASQTRKRTTRRGGGRPTVADVAARAQVSPMTVSRVVNRDPGVLAATRERVEQAITALGYVPNSAARSLAGRKPCRIALLHSNPSAAYLSEFLMGSLAGAAAADAQLVVELWNGTEQPAALAERLRTARIDAVLLPPPLCDDAPLVDALGAARLPFAQIATGAPSTAAVAVTICDEDAAHAMTAHLVLSGHRRIGFIVGNTDQTASALRLAGYRRALAEHGIAEDECLIVQGDFSYRSGLSAAERLLAVEPAPTAIFASNDDMAAAVIAVAHRRHLDVPGDLSVCGFDDSAMATTIWPEITTVRQPIAEMARRATILLAGSVRENEAEAASPRHERLDYELVPRASDAPPANIARR